MNKTPKDLFQLKNIFLHTNKNNKKLTWAIHGTEENVIYAKSICSREKLTLQSCPAIKRHCKVIQER
jgi:hypothetical protein